MAILVDLSQIVMANVMTSPDVFKGKFDDDLITHMIINSIRLLKQKFSSEYGDLIICCDAKNSWRYDHFPFYKQARKSSRDKGPVDFIKVYNLVNKLKTDLKESFPYKVIEAERAEGDDVIAILSRNLPEKHVIISSDKDFKQLHNINVEQYCPRNKTFVEVLNPKHCLMELIILGDRSDGIPNIKSPDNCFVIQGKRQSPIYKKDVDVWVDQDYTEFCKTEEMKFGFERNRKLIDFNYIPEEIKDKILMAYNEPVQGNIKKVMEYLTKNKMRVLLTEIQTF